MYMLLAGGGWWCEEVLGARVRCGRRGRLHVPDEGGKLEKEGEC